MINTDLGDDTVGMRSPKRPNHIYFADRGTRTFFRDKGDEGDEGDEEDEGDEGAGGGEKRNDGQQQR